MPNRLLRILLTRLTPILLLLLLVGCAVSHPAEAIPPAPRDAFSIVILPDTQAYEGKGTKHDSDGGQPLTNPIFGEHIQWILDNIKRQRIVFVSHVGDIVDRNTDAQWTVAKSHMDRLRGKVPFAISPGNHDMTSRGDARLFQKYFPASDFSDFKWYGGTYEGPAPDRYGNNANSYQIFAARGIPFLFLHLECNAPDPVLQWAGAVISKHPERTVLVTTHMLLGPVTKPGKGRDRKPVPDGWMRWSKCHREGNSGEQMWDKLLRKYPQIAFVFCGDQRSSQASRDTRKGDAGNSVCALLSDYMASATKGTGALRLVRFIPSKHVVEVRTIDSRTREPILETHVVRAEDQHQFQVPFALPSK